MSKRFSPRAGAAPTQVRASWPSEFERKLRAPSPYGNGPVERRQGVPTYTTPTRAQVWANARRYGQA